METRALMVACLEMRWNDHRYWSVLAPRGFEVAYLLVLELDQGIVVLDDLVAEILGLGE
jgi:hypothetical protein